MIRSICLLLPAMLLGMLSGCGSAPAETEATVTMEAAPVETVLVETEPPEPEAVQDILAQSWVPEKISSDLDTQIRWTEMLDMLGDVIRLCDESALTEWNSRYTPVSANMERDDGMMAIYEGACVLGIGHQARSNWSDVNAYVRSTIALLENAFR